ncbi:MAG: hypothetical protein E7207_08520 [Clostridium butyricum]|nr:hypothetical protein [Clostridium butyricum]
MLFRIEDNENLDGHCREYEISYDNLPKLDIEELENYIADEIRKEINNSNDRKLLSYSKSLGICLLKYNQYAYNELHINMNNWCDGVYFYDLKNPGVPCYCPFDLSYGLLKMSSLQTRTQIILLNFQVDVSNNNLLDSYLKVKTRTGRKKCASPEKDKEVLCMQSPNDIIISQYLDSVYILYALSLKYGMKKSIYINLINEISNLEEFRFQFCGESERDGLLKIVDYLYRYGDYERKISSIVVKDSWKSKKVPVYYDPISQLHDIQKDSFLDSYRLSDYNENIVSDCIWDCYSQEYL